MRIMTFGELIALEKINELLATTRDTSKLIEEEIHETINDSNYAALLQIVDKRVREYHVDTHNKVANEYILNDWLVNDVAKDIAKGKYRIYADD